MSIPESTGDKKIATDTTMRVIRDAVSGNIDWKLDNAFGYLTASSCKSPDLSEFDPHKIYGKAYSKMTQRLHNERVDYLKGFEGL